MEVCFPKLTSYQNEVWEWLNNGDPYRSGKIAVLKSVRQSGKSFFCQILLIAMALQHRNTVSVVYEPTLALARNIYKNVEKALLPLGIMTKDNSQLLEIELVNGSQILFKSTEQISRGLTVSGLLVLDEAAYLDNESIYTILPLVNAYNAPIIVASTPFTEDGYFYDIYMAGLDGGEQIKSFDWSKNPEISRFLTDERKKFYKQTMSRQKYRTEVEGEFLCDDGLLFTGIEGCLGTADESEFIYVGIDFATGSEGDYTVLSAINNKGQLLRQWRTNNLSPMQQIDWLSEIIIDLSNSYTIRTILAEKNSIGAVYIDALNEKIRDRHIRITEWTTTNQTKHDLVTSLQIAFENQYIQIIDDPILLNELRRYEATINQKTKVITYNGAKGSHDDTVISLMLAWWAYKKGLGNFSISFA